jgi:hypothetical protein
MKNNKTAAHTAPIFLKLTNAQQHYGLIFTKVTNAEQHYAEIFCPECYPNGTKMYSMPKKFYL